MPTPLTHAFVAIAAGKTFIWRKMPLRFFALAALCSALPDLDTLGLRFGIPYAHALGHRGFFHSLPFALLLSVIVVTAAFTKVRVLSRRWWALCVFFILVTGSHGVLDAMTNGGLGIALFAPFDNTRYFLPFRPIQVSPIGLRYFISPWGLAVIKSELICIWGPMTALLLIVRGFRALVSLKLKAPALAPGDPDT